MNKLEQFQKLWGTNWATGKILLPILADWGQQERGVILDFGCGESPFQVFFSYAARYIRMDKTLLDPEVIVTTRDTIPLSNQSVDTVLLFQVLGDLPEPQKFFIEVGRILRKGGRFIIFETTCYPEHDLPDDYYRIMPSGIEFLANKTGFECIDMIRIGGLFTRYTQLWNFFILGKLKSYPVIKWINSTGIIIANIIAYILDKVIPHPSLSPDYLTKLIKQ